MSEEQTIEKQGRKSLSVMVYDVVDNLTCIEISGDNSVILLNRLKNSGTEAETKSSRGHLKTIKLGRENLNVVRGESKKSS